MLGEAVLVLTCDAGQWGQVRQLAQTVIDEWGQVQQLAQTVIDEWGRFDIWGKNAGPLPANSPTWQIPVDRIQQTFETNIHGVVFGSWIAWQHFQQRGCGILINMMGRGSRRAAPDQNTYDSSKAWIASFTRGLAAEVQNDDFREIAFNPGLVYTDLVEEIAAVSGAQTRLHVFTKVMAFSGNPSRVPADRAVWLVTENGRRAGSEHIINTIPFTLKQVIRRSLAILFGKTPAEHPITITPNASAKYRFTVQQKQKRDKIEKNTGYRSNWLHWWATHP